MPENASTTGTTAPVFHGRGICADEVPTDPAQPRCRHCGRLIHRLVNGWAHDVDNFACCLDRYWYGDHALVTAEPEAVDAT